MFKSILNAIFPESGDQTTPNFEFFEKTRNLETEEEIKAKNQNFQNVSDKPQQNTGKPPFSKEFDNDFYSYLFGESTQLNTQDPLSDYVSKYINKLLLNPADLIKEMPVLPESVNAALTSLNNKNFNINDVLTIISREPCMAADTIKLANSAKYQRNNKEVVDLKTAFMNIGSKGLIDGVLYVFINKFQPSSKLYFKCFGHKIWQHCQQTAELSQTLAEQILSENEVSAAYLVGLIRNLGIMVTFQLMIEAFSHIAPDATPSSMAFKQLMSKHSLTLTIAIARHWQLPKIIVQSIEQQHSVQSPMSPLANCVSDANFISKMASLYENNIIDEIQCKKYCHQYLISETGSSLAFDYLSFNTVII